MRKTRFNTKEKKPLQLLGELKTNFADTINGLLSEGLGFVNQQSTIRKIKTDHYYNRFCCHLFLGRLFVQHVNDKFIYTALCF